jgi:SOS response regulatory protein OraA/RecX
MSGTSVVAEIRAAPDDPGMVRLRVGRAWFGPVRREDTDRLGLEEGSRWTRSAEREVRRLVDIHGCRADALARLGRRDHSRALLAARLATRWGETLATATVAALADEGWIDDGAYAARRAESLRRTGPMARELLQARLENEGLDPRIAARASGDREDRAAIRQAVRAWKRSGRDAASIARALGRRGFDVDTIAQALRAEGLPCSLDD